MIVLRVMAISFLCIFILSCDDQKVASHQTPCLSESSKTAPLFRRFEPAFSTDGFGISLDTVTGQWCKSWNWKMHLRDAVLSGLNKLPLCSELLNSDKRDPLGILGSPQDSITGAPADVKDKPDPFAQFGGKAIK